MSSKRKKGFKLTTVVNQDVKASNQMLCNEMRQAGYVEQPLQLHKKSEIDTSDSDLEARLVSWGRVMNPGRHNCSGGGATFWATRYYEIRNSTFRRELIARGLIEPKSVMEKVEELVMTEIAHQEAIEVERAWGKLGVFQHKQALLMFYVLRMPPETIRVRLGLRGRENLKLILWRAKLSLKKILDGSKKADIIQPAINQDLTTI